MARLTKTRHAAVVAHKESLAFARIFRVLRRRRHIALVHALVVMHENGRYVDAVRTRHAVFAVVARDGWILENKLSHILEELQVVVSQVDKRRVSVQILLQMLHVGHAAQDGQHIREVAGIAERPRRHRRVRHTLLERLHHMVGQRSQSATEQRLHDDGRDAALLQFRI